MLDIKTLSGLRIESEISLGRLIDSGTLSCDAQSVRIRRVSFDALEQYRESGNGITGFALTPPRIGSFLITRHNEILVAPLPDANERDVLGFLLGPCFAAVSYLNGIFPLHASSVDMPAGRVAFAGNSGAGKSTLVGLLGARGYEICSDDVCFIRNSTDGRVLAWPGIRWLRLTSQSAKFLGQPFDAVDDGKFIRRKQHVPLPAMTNSSSSRDLTAIYILDEAEPGMPDSFIRVTGTKAVERILSNAYRYQFARGLLLLPEVLKNSVAIASRVPVFHYRRAMGLGNLNESINNLERHIAKQVVAKGEEKIYSC